MRQRSEAGTPGQAQKPWAVKRDPTALQAVAVSGRAGGHCWSMEAPGPPGPAPRGSSGRPATALLGGPMSPPEAASQHCGHTSHCPFALTVPFPVAERLVPTPFPFLGARSERGQEPQGHSSSYLSVPRDPEPSSAAMGTRAFFLRGLPAVVLGHLPAARLRVCGPHPHRWARRVRDSLVTLSWGCNGLGRAVLRPLTEEGSCHPGGRESCPESPGHWSSVTGGHHRVKSLQEGAGMPSYKAPEAGKEACGCRLGLEEQAMPGSPGFGPLSAALPTSTGSMYRRAILGALGMEKEQVSLRRPAPP